MPFPELDDRTVHLWTIRLQAPAPTVRSYYTLLSSEEKVRAGRFAFDHLRTSFVLAHGALRALLAGYMGESPENVSFCYGRNGKPSLAGGGRIQFNLSHSGDFALLGFILDCEIGVDIEAIRPIPDLLAIASQFFCPEEEAELRTIGAEQQALSFALCWTRKEAFIKAQGDGLSIPLDSFRVSLQPGQQARFLALPPGQAETSWTLQGLDAPDGFAAAVAYPSAPRNPVMFPLVDAGDLRGRIHV